MTPTNIRSDRSRIELRQKCQKARYLGNHYQGTGLEKVSGRYEAFFGQLVHKALANSLLGRTYTMYRNDMEALETEICTIYGRELTDHQLDHLIREQQWLLVLLVEGWCRYRMPVILNEYDVVSVEQETTVVFQPSDYLPADFAYLQRPLELPLRRDALLRRRRDGTLFILDWKTTRAASEDWNTNLDNSLQSCLYIEGTERATGEYVGGIFYEGLVKGHRQMDNARSSPYNGQVIQYGSFLYGWKDKQGNIHKDYVSGRERVFLFGDKPAPNGPNELNDTFVMLSQMGWNIPSYFPSTLPWKPRELGKIIGQTIVNENLFTNNLEFYESMPEGSPEKDWYANILFEQTLSSCHKYGPKHPCQFVEICHQGLHEDELKQIYTPRVDHHGTDE